MDRIRTNSNTDKYSKD